jgi:glycosyltransferase involved in cell wall biosynthesis
MKRIEVSIIILTKNAGSTFKNVLEGVMSQDYKFFETIIIDSGSTDDTLKLAKKYPLKIINIQPSEFGHGKTRNLGAKIAKGKYVVYLTHDAIPKNSKWLSELIKPLKEKKIVGVYGRQIPKENENILDKFFYISIYSKKDHSWRSNKVYQGDNIFSDVNSAIKKDVLVKYPFNDNIIVSEDYEWAHRVLKKGYEIFYNSKATVIHSHSYSIRVLFKRNFDIGVSYKEIYMKNHDPNFIKKGIRIHLKELNYLVKAGYLQKIPYCIIKDFVKLIAVTLGKNEHLIPKYIKIRFSNYREHWK